MHPAVEDAIRRMADEQGIDPAFALAVAERESAGNPYARASRSIAGIYQMSGDLRRRYGSGDSADPYTQAQAWGRFINATKQGLGARLGREPTNNELYYAHHFGEGRAAAMIGGGAGGNTWVGDVFTPYERALNPHFDRAGTTGRLMSSIGNDMDRRMARFGGETGWTASAQNPIDFSAFGTGKDGVVGNQPIDFSAFGDELREGPKQAPTYQGDRLGLTAGDPDQESVDNVAGITKSGIANHADWGKFEREATPSTNVEDNRQGQLGYPSPRQDHEQDARPQDFGLSPVPYGNHPTPPIYDMQDNQIGGTLKNPPLPRPRPAGLSALPGSEIDPSEWQEAA